MSVIDSSYFNKSPSLWTEREFVQVGWYTLDYKMRRAVMDVQHVVALAIDVNYDRIRAIRRMH